MRRGLAVLAVLVLLLCAGVAEAQTVGAGRGITSSGPNLVRNTDGTYSAPGKAPIATAAGTSTDVTRPSGLLCVVTTDQATTGLVEEVLATCTIKGGTLARNGDTLRVIARGRTAANGNAKTVRMRLGGLAGTEITIASTTSNNLGWRLEAEIIRTAAATQDAGGWGVMGAANTLGRPVTAAANLANDVDLVVTGATPAAIGDTTLDQMLVYLDRAP